MRQAGTLTNERDARRFAAWLLTQRIEAHAEEQDGNWAVWVRDEDQLPQAREALAHFREHPDDPQYAAVAKLAGSLKSEQAKRPQQPSNVIDMRRRWGSGASGGGIPRRCPLVLLMAAISILVGIATNLGRAGNEVLPSLEFVDPQLLVAHGEMWANVRSGEVWRLITPAFIHFGMMHLVMNLFVLWDFGGQIEDRRGTRFFALLVFVLAVLSNAGQATEMQLRHNFAGFGGLSGVGYGLFGYLLVKVKFDNRAGYALSPGTTFLLLLWFVVCIAAEFPPLDALLGDTLNVANTAHAVGFFLGMAIAYAPLLVHKPA